MRQVIVQVPAEHGERVLELARRFDGINLSRLAATDGGGRELAVVLAHLSNASVGPFVDALEVVPEPRISMIPAGVLALQPPAEAIVDQVTDVAPRSPLEVFVAGLQSIGSWKGFLGYAVAGGVVVWLGLFTNTVYLLIGAMLIAPFAGPAVNTAVATARGDLELLWRSLLRYAVALLVTAAVAALLSLVARQDVATEMMTTVSTISAAAVLLPLVAGAAGALHLCQGEQSSLVSGAASGMLIAASLAPPAGLVGMASVAGDAAMLTPALFLLALQLVGINLAGAVVFRLFGLTPVGARYERGHGPVRWASLLVTAAGLAALLAWQYGSERPTLERATVEQRLRDVALGTLGADERVEVVEASLRFTRASASARNPLLVVLYLRRAPGAGAAPPTDAALRAEVADDVRGAIRRREPSVTARIP